ncbi:hypothetical protein BEL04_09390 [Mucilaginibacter sp. PPCGB 2223]|uniref:hypothetical protein n=1 Tax=Mucilaginibacter sp. PPCGB 2223 TaxID=1886027 RepID=UPI0008240EEC|nr:hypothetical protein [Mucilaginibacter sp. PPCGB 2223]OCX54445.1 hypothetical protein BEL04_09390 [Mucilaginibacter sp. PPCGB 2223]
MDNLDDLKALWLSANTDPLPQPAEMLRMVKKFRNQKIRRKVIIIVIALACSCIMLWGIFFDHATMVTTYIGDVLLIISCVILAVTNIRSVKRFYELKDCTNSEFVQFIERTRQNQIYFYKKTQVIAMSVSSVGLMLYWYEFVHHNATLTIIIYSATVVYLAVMWFVVRPRVFKKNARKLNEMLERLEKISKQF